VWNPRRAENHMLRTPEVPVWSPMHPSHMVTGWWSCALPQRLGSAQRALESTPSSAPGQAEGPGDFPRLGDALLDARASIGLETLLFGGWGLPPRS
jgi:hypothetical protein